MTILELSVSYWNSASAIRLRIRELRVQIRSQPDGERAQTLQKRISALEPLLREMQELAQLTAHYYERGYYRDEKYII